MALRRDRRRRRRAKALRAHSLGEHHPLLFKLPIQAPVFCLPHLPAFWFTFARRRVTILWFSLVLPYYVRAIYGYRAGSARVYHHTFKHNRFSNWVPCRYYYLKGLGSPPAYCIGFAFSTRGRRKKGGLLFYGFCYMASLLPPPLCATLPGGFANTLPPARVPFIAVGCCGFTHLPTPPRFITPSPASSHPTPAAPLLPFTYVHSRCPHTFYRSSCHCRFTLYIHTTLSAASLPALRDSWRVSNSPWLGLHATTFVDLFS